MSNAERGSVSLAMAAMAGVIVVMTVAVSSLTLVYGGATRAGTAADAAALAAAVATYPSAAESSPLQAAREIARRNGATLVSCRCVVDVSLARRSVEVGVSVSVDVPILGNHVVVRRARAEFDPRAWLGQ